MGIFRAVPAISSAFGSSPFIAAIALGATPERAASELSVSPGRTVYAPSGPGAAAGTALGGVALPAALAPGVAASAAAASATVGTFSAEPSTTRASGESPLYAAKARLVRLFAEAIDHRVSPGWTTWATDAWALPAGSSAAAAMNAMRRARTWGLLEPGNAPHRSQAPPTCHADAQGSVKLQALLRRGARARSKGAPPTNALATRWVSQVESRSPSVLFL